MADQTANPLISTKASDSNLSISLHPLVLLTISDQITRHQVRGQSGAIVGALLGQQKGREVSAEHAFPCSMVENDSKHWLLDLEWMERRIQQYKDVHKAPVLELVGLFTLCPESGPTAEIVPLQRQVTAVFNDSAVLLTLHASAFSSSGSSLASGKLPLTIYESIIETDTAKEEGSMQVDGEDGSELKFRPLSYTIETDETEMIAIDYVAKGAGSAAATVESDAPANATTSEQTSKKGKKKAEASDGEPTANDVKHANAILTTEEEDQIAGMTTRLNSVKMLQSRLALLTKFLKSQPPSYISDLSIPLSAESPDPTSLPHLRNIQALLTRLALLDQASGSPGSADTVGTASQAQMNDVKLSSLLSLLGQDIQGMSEMGRKFATVESAKNSRGKGKMAYGQDSFGSMDDQEDRVGGFQMAGNMLV